MQNPLLDFNSLPRFGDIKPEHVSPAIDELLIRCNGVISELEKPTAVIEWDHFVTPLEDCTEQLSRAWGIVSHMNAVVDTPALRAAYNENVPKITEFWASLSQNLILFEKYKALGNSSDFDKLSKPRKKIIGNAIRDFRLGGAELSDDKKPRYMEIQERMAAISTRFSENVLDATNDFSLFVEDERELSGLPEDVKYAAQAAAKADNKSGYKFTLHFPSYFPVLQFADNPKLRETLYRAYVTRASELGVNPEWDNTSNILDLLKLRKEEAELLGYPNFAEVSLVPKMAQSPQEVISFLEDLAVRARPFAERDFAELTAFAKTELGIDSMSAWDMTYASEKLQEKRYAFSNQEVKQYFPEAQVIEGLFKLVQTLFSVQIRPDVAPVWHQDVKFYRIEKQDGSLIGQFYFDLYARPGKRGGAWMDDARGRRAVKSGIQTPIAYLTCNFTAPVVKNGELQASFFTHDEVSTLFHEFGHGLHHLLTQMEDLGISGISGVEWDAVELPSQFLENFCWEWEILEHMTAHAETKKPLPRELFDKMLAAKHFQSGLQTLRQVEFSLTDMHLHYDFDPNGNKKVQDVLNEVRSKYAVIVPPEFNRFLNSFNHIFSGGYAAGYYSYKWAELLSADVYSAFEEAKNSNKNIISPEMGSKLLKEILGVGGSRPAIESFEAFRGRKPTIDALLRHNGLVS